MWSTIDSLEHSPGALVPPITGGSSAALLGGHLCVFGGAKASATFETKSEKSDEPSPLANDLFSLNLASGSWSKLEPVNGRSLEEVLPLLYPAQQLLSRTFDAQLPANSSSSQLLAESYKVYQRLAKLGPDAAPLTHVPAPRSFAAAASLSSSSAILLVPALARVQSRASQLYSSALKEVIEREREATGGVAVYSEKAGKTAAVPPSLCAVAGVVQIGLPGAGTLFVHGGEGSAEPGEKASLSPTRFVRDIELEGGSLTSLEVEEAASLGAKTGFKLREMLSTSTSAAPSLGAGVAGDIVGPIPSLETVASQDTLARLKGMSTGAAAAGGVGLSSRLIFDDLHAFDFTEAGDKVPHSWRKIDTTANALRIASESTKAGDDAGARVAMARAFTRPAARRRHAACVFSLVERKAGSLSLQVTTTTKLLVYGGAGMQAGRGDSALGDLWLVEVGRAGSEVWSRIHGSPSLMEPPAAKKAGGATYGYQSAAPVFQVEYEVPLLRPSPPSTRNRTVGVGAEGDAASASSGQPKQEPVEVHFESAMDLWVPGNAAASTKKQKNAEEKTNLAMLPLIEEQGRQFRVVPPPREGTASGVVANGWFICGGRNDNATALNDLWRLELADGFYQWCRLGPLPFHHTPSPEEISRHLQEKAKEEAQEAKGGEGIGVLHSGRESASQADSAGGSSSVIGGVGVGATERCRGSGLRPETWWPPSFGPGASLIADPDPSFATRRFYLVGNVNLSSLLAPEGFSLQIWRYDLLLGLWEVMSPGEASGSSDTVGNAAPITTRLAPVVAAMNPIAFSLPVPRHLDGFYHWLQHLPQFVYVHHVRSLLADARHNQGSASASSLGRRALTFTGAGLGGGGGGVTFGGSSVAPSRLGGAAGGIGGGVGGGGRRPTTPGAPSKRAQSAGSHRSSGTSGGEEERGSVATGTVAMLKKTAPSAATSTVGVGTPWLRDWRLVLLSKTRSRVFPLVRRKKIRPGQEQAEADALAAEAIAYPHSVDPWTSLFFAPQPLPVLDKNGHHHGNGGHALSPHPHHQAKATHAAAAAYTPPAPLDVTAPHLVLEALRRGSAENRGVESPSKSRSSSARKLAPAASATSSVSIPASVFASLLGQYQTRCLGSGLPPLHPNSLLFVDAVLSDCLPPGTGKGGGRAAEEAAEEAMLARFFSSAMRAAVADASSTSPPAWLPLPGPGYCLSDPSLRRLSLGALRKHYLRVGAALGLRFQGNPLLPLRIDASYSRVKGAPRLLPHHSSVAANLLTPEEEALVDALSAFLPAVSDTSTTDAVGQKQSAKKKEEEEKRPSIAEAVGTTFLADLLASSAQTVFRLDPHYLSGVVDQLAQALTSGSGNALLKMSRPPLTTLASSSTASLAALSDPNPVQVASSSVAKAKKKAAEAARAAAICRDACSPRLILLGGMTVMPQSTLRLPLPASSPTTHGAGGGDGGGGGGDQMSGRTFTQTGVSFSASAMGGALPSAPEPSLASLMMSGGGGGGGGGGAGGGAGVSASVTSMRRLHVLKLPLHSYDPIADWPTLNKGPRGLVETLAELITRRRRGIYNDSDKEHDKAVLAGSLSPQERAYAASLGVVFIGGGGGGKGGGSVFSSATGATGIGGGGERGSVLGSVVSSTPNPHGPPMPSASAQQWLWSDSARLFGPLQQARIQAGQDEKLSFFRHLTWLHPGMGLSFDDCRAYASACAPTPEMLLSMGILSEEGVAEAAQQYKRMVISTATAAGTKQEDSGPSSASSLAWKGPLLLMELYCKRLPFSIETVPVTGVSIPAPFAEGRQSPTSPARSRRPSSASVFSAIPAVVAAATDTAATPEGAAKPSTFAPSSADTAQKSPPPPPPLWKRPGSGSDETVQRPKPGETDKAEAAAQLDVRSLPPLEAPSSAPSSKHSSAEKAPKTPQPPPSFSATIKNKPVNLAAFKSQQKKPPSPPSPEKLQRMAEEARETSNGTAITDQPILLLPAEPQGLRLVIALGRRQRPIDTSASSSAAKDEGDEDLSIEQEDKEQQGAGEVSAEPTFSQRFLLHSLASLRTRRSETTSPDGKLLVSTAMPRLFEATSTLQIDAFGNARRGQTLKELPEPGAEDLLPQDLSTSLLQPSGPAAKTLFGADPAATVKGTPFGSPSSALANAAAKVLLGTSCFSSSSSPPLGKTGGEMGTMTPTAGGAGRSFATRTGTLIAPGYDQASLSASSVSNENILQRGMLRTTPHYFREGPTGTMAQARKARPQDYNGRSMEVKFNHHKVEKEEKAGKEAGSYEVSFKLASLLPDVSAVPSTLGSAPYPPFSAPSAASGSFYVAPSTAAAASASPSSRLGMEEEGGEESGGQGYVIYSARTATAEELPGAAPSPSATIPSARATAPTSSPTSSVVSLDPATLLLERMRAAAAAREREENDVGPPPDVSRLEKEEARKAIKAGGSGAAGAKGGSPSGPSSSASGAALSPFKRAKMAAEIKKSVFGSVMPTVVTKPPPHLSFGSGNALVAKVARESYLKGYSQGIKHIKGGAVEGEEESIV